jgi:Flp pilus assembly protein TadG
MKAQPAVQRSAAGQSLVEFALVLPLLFLLIVNVLNFGGMLYAWVTVANAARSGAQYMMMGGSTAHSPIAPTAAQISAVVTQDLLSLPNRASAVVRVCKNNNGTVTCTPAGGTPPTDPEPTFYILGTVEVTYTYVPFVSLWSFPRMGINLTPPPTTIHRQVAMRMGGG